MALSRIWSAFIIIAIAIAGYKCFSGDEKIFSRMLTGKADDAYDTVYYHSDPTPAPEQSKHLSEYGYLISDSLHPATVLIVDNDKMQAAATSNPGLQVYTWNSIQTKLIRKTDGIIETCKSAVNISISLIRYHGAVHGLYEHCRKSGWHQPPIQDNRPFLFKTIPRVAAGASRHGAYDDEFFSQSAWP